MRAMVTNAMASMGMMVVVMMPAGGPTVNGLMISGGMMRMVACCGSRARRNNDCSTEEKNAEEFHWSLPIRYFPMTRDWTVKSTLLGHLALSATVTYAVKPSAVHNVPRHCHVRG
jgi:hypothetical protein